MQQALLKILEGTVANIPPQGGRKHPEQQYIQIDTTNILFICGGAFDGLPEIIAERLNAKKVGFRKEGDSAAQDRDAIDLEDLHERARLFSHAGVQDLLRYGMIPGVCRTFTGDHFVTATGSRRPGQSFDGTSKCPRAPVPRILPHGGR